MKSQDNNEFSEQEWYKNFKNQLYNCENAEQATFLFQQIISDINDMHAENSAYDEIDKENIKTKTIKKIKKVWDTPNEYTKTLILAICNLAFHKIYGTPKKIKEKITNKIIPKSHQERYQNKKLSGNNEKSL